MAFVTGTAIGDPLVRIAWSDKLHRQLLNRLFFTKMGMMGDDKGNEDPFEERASYPIIMQEALNARRAQQVRVGLRDELTRAPRDTDGNQVYTYGSGNMIDQEEVMSLRDFTVWVELLKHATGFDLPDIEDLRTEFDLVEEAGGALNTWLAKENEECILDAYYDGFSAHVTGNSLASTVTHGNRYYAGTASSGDELGPSDQMSTDELRRMYEWATENNINPIVYDGMNCFVLLAHPRQCTSLDADSEFRQAQQVNVRGQDNPLFSRAFGYYEGIFIYEYNRIRQGTGTAQNASIRRSILTGADAVGRGVASRPRLVRRKEDKYEDFFGLGIKQISGESRADFVNTADSDTLNQSSAEWWTYAASALS